MLNLFKRYLILTPWERNIGNAAEQIFYGLLTAKIKKQKLILLVRQPTFLRNLLKKWVKTKITNREIFKIRSPYIVISGDSMLAQILGKILDFIFIFFYFINLVLRKLSKSKTNFHHFFELPTFGQELVFNPKQIKRFSWEVVNSYNWDKMLTEGVSVYLSEEKRKIAKEVFQRMGLPPDCWYVGLHVRETGFHHETEKQGSYRSADILNYVEAIEYIIARGGWVVRLGDSTMMPLPKKEHVIDYPHTKYKSDLMDLYLIKNCRLYIGMDSGIWDIAHLFQKRSVMINVTGWNLAFLPMYGDLAITKYFFSKSRRRFLSVKELLEEPHEINFHFTIPSEDKNNDYIVVENTPADIRKLVEEKLNQPESYCYSNLQNLFIEKRRLQIKRWIHEDPYFKRWTTQKYRLATRYFYKGTLGNNFLENNWEYGDYLVKMTERFRKTNGI